MSVVVQTIHHGTCEEGSPRGHLTVNELIYLLESVPDEWRDLRVGRDCLTKGFTGTVELIKLDGGERAVELE